MHQVTRHATAPTAEQLVAANSDAAEFYRRQLLGPAGASPRRYLIGRGFEAVLDDNTQWGLGYAPASWIALADHLAELGYSEAVLRQAGLTKATRAGEVIDTFRDRITFTIHNPNGSAIGFTGRCGPHASAMTPKYLNTTTTPVFDKSQALFGLSEAGMAKDNLVVTEGPLDAIAIDLATGPDTAAVATCGTAFTAAHAQRIGALNPGRVTLAFDADVAGTKATLNSYRHLGEVDDLRAIRMRAGSDPAQLFSDHGPALLTAVLNAARPAADAIVDAHLRTWRIEQTGAEAELCLLREILTDIRRMPAHDVARQVSRVSTLLGFDHQTVTRELLDTSTAQSHSRSHAPSRPGVDYRTASTTVRALRQ